ncbi:unnamed protein product [Pleuronectes platessa]|uniref:Uncharacterized protein n=1 Tax=Pleuronectes platessa TaxID=8262 RepID=A0A9N7V615_PLEPL|nr:unnamed protein product [Pleuronectes platessa]
MTSYAAVLGAGLGIRFIVNKAPHRDCGSMCSHAQKTNPRLLSWLKNKRVRGHIERIESAPDVAARLQTSQYGVTTAELAFQFHPPVSGSCPGLRRTKRTAIISYRDRQTEKRGEKERERETGKDLSCHCGSQQGQHKRANCFLGSVRLGLPLKLPNSPKPLVTGLKERPGNMKVCIRTGAKASPLPD